MIVLRFFLGKKRMFGKSEDAAKLDALSRSQAMIEFLPDGTIVDANENFLRAVGYTIEEVRGKNHAMFVEDGYRQSPEYKRFWDELRAGHFQMPSSSASPRAGARSGFRPPTTPCSARRAARPRRSSRSRPSSRREARQRRREGPARRALHRAQAIIEFDLTGKILDANENFLNAVG